MALSAPRTRNETLFLIDRRFFVFALSLLLLLSSPDQFYHPSNCRAYLCLLYLRHPMGPAGVTRHKIFSYPVSCGLFVARASSPPRPRPFLPPGNNWNATAEIFAEAHVHLLLRRRRRRSRRTFQFANKYTILLYRPSSSKQNRNPANERHTERWVGGCGSGGGGEAPGEP